VWLFSAEVPVSILQGVERLQEPVESCDVARDIQTVVSIKGTGQPIPEQLLPDFYAEHITLAMNRDRRRQVCVLNLLYIHVNDEKTGWQIYHTPKLESWLVPAH
jgi:hypothetical protein